ncbi:uncharacterized protein RBU33_000623 [Hipposideros larvatus]
MGHFPSVRRLWMPAGTSCGPHLADPASSFAQGAHRGDVAVPGSSPAVPLAPSPAATPRSRAISLYPSPPRPATLKQPSLPRALPGPTPPGFAEAQVRVPAFVCWRRGAHTTASHDPSAVRSSGYTHVEPAGPRRSPEPVSSSRLRVQFPGSPTTFPPVPVHPSLARRLGFGQKGSPFPPARSPSHFPTKPPSFPHRSGKESPTQEQRCARRAPPGAGPRCGAGRWPACWVPSWGAPQARHPPFLQRRHLAAAVLQERDPAAPVLPLPRAPRVRAPGLQMLPGWRHQDFRAAPPSPAATLRSLHLESSWRLGCSIQDWAPPLRAGLPSLRVAAQSPHFPPASCTHLFL